MRVVLLSWCPTSPVHLDALVASGASVVRVITGEEAPAARAFGGDVPVERVRSPGSASLVGPVRDASPDAMIVAGWPRILSGEVFDAPRLGTVNLHPSLLPAHRGRDPLFWALLHGETIVGITAHRMTADVDAGAILAQDKVPVPHDATTRSLSEIIDVAGAGLVPRVLDALERREPGRPQGEGSSFPPVTERDTVLDFRRPPEALERLVRASLGARSASTSRSGMKLVVLQAHVGGPCCAAPGTIVEISGAGAVIATGGASAGTGDPSGSLIVSRWAFCAKVHDAPSLAEHVGLEVGARLGD